MPRPASTAASRASRSGAIASVRAGCAASVRQAATLPIKRGLQGLDLYYDIFNVLNKENLVPPTGNRRSANFMISTSAQFARQMQFGVRVRF